MSENNNASANRDLHYLQLKLASLLQKKRDAEGNRLVNQIISSPSSVDEKIRRIQAMDSGNSKTDDAPSEAIPQKFVKKPKIQKELPGGLEQQKPPPGILEIQRNRRRQKAIIPKVGFFRYLFTEGERISRFGDSTQTLETGFLALSIKLDRHLLGYFSDKHREILVKPLLGYLNFYLKKAWLYLTKKEYNHIAALRDLAQALVNFPFAQMSRTSRHMVTRFKAIEDLFFIFYQDPGAIPLLERALDICETHIQVSGSKRPKTLLLSRRLLARDKSQPSLYNFILALNILSSRRYLELDDLMLEGVEGLVSSEDFDAPHEIQEHIRDQVTQLESRLEPLSHQYKRILGIRSFLPVGYDGNLDFSLLEQLYSLGTEDEDFANLMDDKKNIMAVMPRLGMQFLDHIRPLLHEQIQTEDGKLFQLFEPTYYGTVFSRLEYNLGKLIKLQTLMPNFKFERYQTLRQTRKGAIPNEASILEIMDGILADLYSLAENLSEILTRRLHTAAESPSTKPISTIAVQKAAYFLPMEWSKIQAPGFLGGRTPGDLITMVIQICFLACWLFEYHEIHSTLRKQGKVHDTIRALLEDIRRMSSRERYHKILSEVNP